MTHVGPAPLGSSATATAGASFVEWGAVLAGAFLAAAISFVLLTFGAAIGLSATSPWPNSGASAKVVVSLAVFWAMVQQIGAFMAGGYVAGRMRSRWHEVGHEAEFRDGLHGGLVWAVGVVIGAALFLSTAGSVAKTGAEVAGGAAAVAGSSTSDPIDAVLDTMLRPATKRSNDASNGAREAADKARRAGVLIGCVTAASLVLSLGAAWWAALRGGHHRDNSIPARFVFGDRHRRTTPTT